MEFSVLFIGVDKAAGVPLASLHLRWALCMLCTAQGAAISQSVPHMTCHSSLTTKGQ